jgi:uncharacterized protein (DUF1501 family)
MTKFDLRRRRLVQTLAVGAMGPLSGLRFAWAGPMPPERPNAADGRRLIVVMLRGALDGLAAVPPVGDPALAGLRPHAGPDAERFGAPLPLPGTPFALHPALVNLHGWFGDGQLLIAHAVASPYRERSHFDAQQLLESGGSRPFELLTGWLGRALQATGGQGVALGPAVPLALRGADGATSWAPSDETLPEPEWLDRVARLYGDDPRLAAAFGHARAQRDGGMVGMSSATGDMAGPDASANRFAALAAQAGRMLAAPLGPDIAWLDLNGWDTHTQQAARLGRLLASLDGALAALRGALGERWARTCVLVMTEFGRAAALNGSGGTDHGTAGVAFLAGGDVAGGRVIGDWPGVAPSQLYQGRDLRPTHDLRTLMKPLLQRQLGLSAAVMDRDVLAGAPAGRTDLWRA